MNTQLEALSRLDPGSKDYLLKGITCLANIDRSACASRNELLGLINRLIADIDRTVSEQLSKLYEHPKFQALESSWGGLALLVNLPVSMRRTGVRFLDISAEEIAEDLDVARAIERTQLYNLIANREFNTLGGKPYGLLLVSQPINIDSPHPEIEINVAVARSLTDLAAATLSPVLFSPAEAFFGEEDARWLSDKARMSRLMESAYFEEWRRFRSHPTARFAGVVLPAFRLRESYRDHRAGVIFNQSSEQSVGLWCNAVFIFAATVVREFSRTSWFGFLRGVWRDRFQGAIANLEPQLPGSMTLKQSHSRYCFSKETAEFYNRYGFIVATWDSISRKAMFLENVSIQQRSEPETNRLGTRLETTLAACRISHYVKKRARKMLGELRTAAECESELTTWLSRYTTELDAGDEQLLCRYPLRSFSLSVRPEVDGRSVSCHLDIVPQWQLDEVGGDINIAIEYDS